MRKGFPLKVLERSNVPGEKTADASLFGVLVDFKRPIGSSYNTIDGLVRDAGRKSDVVIFYLEPDVSTITLDDLKAHFVKCVRRRSIPEALIVGYDDSLEQIKS